MLRVTHIEMYDEAITASEPHGTVQRRAFRACNRPSPRPDLQPEYTDEGCEIRNVRPIQCKERKEMRLSGVAQNRAAQRRTMASRPRFSE